MELEEIKGLGPKRITLLKKAGINNPVDLLYCFPVDYISEEKNEFAKVNVGENAVVKGILDKIKVNFISRSLNITTANIIDSDGQIVRLKWFNQRFVKNSFEVRQSYCLYGLKKQSGKEVYILNPKKIVFDKKIIPLYNKIDGVSGSLIAQAIDCVLKYCNIRSLLPAEIEDKYGIKDINRLFFDIHNATDIEIAQKNRKLLALYHLTLQIAAFRLSLPEDYAKRRIVYRDNNVKLKEAIDALPFELTCQQLSVLDSIIHDLHSDITMNRLIQGDVGCGKTIVALLAMYYSFLSGYQSVLMAPTELLCEQHYNTALFFERFGVKVAILTGSQSKALRQKILFDIKYGAVDFIIATHSILSDDVLFYKLGLTVTDEQQRFGVAQRAILKRKADADFITLSATPIPRTLAMVMYGELTQSVIAAKPTLRPSIKTSFVPDVKINSMYDYFLKKAEKGEQTYIVCPRIENDDDDELVSCKDLYEKLSKTALKPYIALLHGKIDDESKIRIMKDFAEGKVRILISTTIIEVGIDVKNATSIAIFNPERYGLSQLHQLRGRVGRGSLESYCFLVTDERSERLKLFSDTDDGFELAEYDLKTRGAGDFIGLKQHGKTEIIKNINIDAELIKQAGTIADELLLSHSFSSKLKAVIDTDFKEIILN